jgi:hypothetical protein
MVSDRLRRTQQLNYRSPPARYPLNAKKQNEFGVLDDVARELAQQLYAAQQEPPDKGIVPATVRKAACRLFDISTARDGGPMDQAAYHIAILGKFRRTIQGMARAIMINNNIWPSLKRFVE